MASKEATARIKINKLLEATGWRFFPEVAKPANIRLEPSVTIKSSDLDSLGENFEKTSKGFVDFLLLDSKSFPLIVLEAKSEKKSPLFGKEQARKYAKSLNCRFVILSNGNLHYFWDLERGNPYVITNFPTPNSVTSYKQVKPNPKRLIEEPVDYNSHAFPARWELYRDGSWDGYNRISDTGKKYMGHYEIVDKWTDSEGNIWYKTHVWDGVKVEGHPAGYELAKFSNSGKVREYIDLGADFPTEIDKNHPQYRIYYRQES